MAEKKVLVVDDEVHIVHVVTIKLRNNGYEVITASNGSEAYELACSENPDIIVTDYQMPVMNGLDFVEKVRANQQMKHIPVIMLTARSFVIENEQKERFGIDRLLSKPFSPKELLMDIDDIIYQMETANNH